MSRKICREVGIATDAVLLGTQVEGMSDAELADAAGTATLFARLSPAHKQRVIKALQKAIPTDDADPEQVARPRPWSIGQITRYILFVGPCSSVFDYATFFVMLYAFGCWDPANASLFQTAWFVESLLTQTLIIHVIRTNRIPFLQSRASWPLIATTVAVMAVGASLPFSPVGPLLGFTPLPLLYWPVLAAILLGYVVLTQVVKTWLLRRGWVCG